jgi:hypothetical protein
MRTVTTLPRTTSPKKAGSARAGASGYALVMSSSPSKPAAHGRDTALRSGRPCGRGGLAVEAALRSGQGSRLGSGLGARGAAFRSDGLAVVGVLGTGLSVEGVRPFGRGERVGVRPRGRVSGTPFRKLSGAELRTDAPGALQALPWPPERER